MPIQGIKHLSVILIFVTSISLSLSAQKIEKENRIPSDNFPALSTSYLDEHFPGRSHQKLYLQTGSSGLAYEAKFSFEDRQFSILFNENGQWIDTEKEIQEEELPLFVLENMKLTLVQHYDKYIFKRIQKQETVNGIRYEIELKGKSKGEMTLFEYLFDSEGYYINHETIIIENYTNEF